MWEVWTRCVAWHWMGANAEFQICNRVGILKHRPRMPPFIGTANPSRLATMIRSCLHDDPAKRPTAAQLVEAQLEMVKNIRRMQVATKGPVRERDAHNSDDVDAALDAECKCFCSNRVCRSKCSQSRTHAHNLCLNRSSFVNFTRSDRTSYRLFVVMVIVCLCLRVCVGLCMYVFSPPDSRAILDECRSVHFAPKSPR